MGIMNLFSELYQRHTICDITKQVLYITEVVYKITTVL